MIQVKNINIDGGHIIATTTLTMNAGHVNAKSLIKSYPNQASQASLALSSGNFYFLCKI